MRRRLLPFYATFIALIAIAFAVQMLHGICPVP
jgi:hypothetical protein